MSLVEAWLRRVGRWVALVAVDDRHTRPSALSAAGPAGCRSYAEKTKRVDPETPLRWLRELFAKYVPPTAFEMRKSFSHIVPLGIMNFVGTLCAILEVRL